MAYIMTNLCTNCAHCQKGSTSIGKPGEFYPSGYVCRHPRTAQPDLVVGGELYPDCKLARLWSQPCSTQWDLSSPREQPMPDAKKKPWWRFW